MASFVSSGVLPQSGIQDLFNNGSIVSLGDQYLNPASLDLTATEEAYRIERVVRPSGKRGERVRGLLPLFGATRIAFGHVLEAGASYLVKANIDLNLPPSVYGYANAKSTSGRNMVLCRVLVDGVEGYDTAHIVGGAVVGEVWIVIEPLVYPIYLTNKERYAQIRFFTGDSRIMSEEGLAKELVNQPLLLRQNGERYKEGELTLRSGDGAVFTTLYAKAGRLVGFRARKTRTPLDLTRRGLDPRGYFEPVYAETDPCDPTGGVISFEPAWYYLMSTNEQVNVPSHMSSELLALDPRLGLFFSHFAGFFDPGFCGVPTLEMTCVHPVTIRHREAVARFRFEYLTGEAPSYRDVGTYAGQVRTTLPKQFAMPSEWREAMC